MRTVRLHFISSIAILTILAAPVLLYGQAVQQLWGTTTAGGSGNLGVIFKMNADGTGLVVQKEFSYSTTNKNIVPSGVGLLEASNGKFYGLVSGGAANYGSLFEFDPATSAYSAVHDFGVTSSDGNYPLGRPIQTSNGKIYGMTSSGGANKQGIIWEYDPSTKTYTKKYDFNSPAGPGSSAGSFLLAPNGKLYALGQDTIFEFDPATGTVTVKYTFDDSTTGFAPTGDLILAPNGKMYGTAPYGGAGSYGTLFEFDYSSGTFTLKYTFGVGGNTTNGVQPSGALADGGNGKLYGLTNQGGANNLGVLYEFNPATGSFAKKIDFNGVSNGSLPSGALTLAGNGKLYGVTRYGGANNKGVFLEYDPNANLSVKKFDLDGSTNGANPFDGALLKATNGKLYGLMAAGGANNTGGLLEYDPINGSNVLKFSFGKSSDGIFPPGELAIGPNKKLYGVTESGGTSNHGVIYEIDPSTSVFNVRANFSLATTGYEPIGRMVVVNGKMYGTTYYGGVNSYFSMNANYGDGTIFEFDPATFTISKKFDFDFNTSGSNPFAGLTMAPNGKLYGVTSTGGAFTGGTLFEFDPVSSTFTKKFDFNQSTSTSVVFGIGPESALVLAPNNKLYGTSRLGGTNGRGTIFEFDPTTSVLTKTFDFNNTADSPFAPRGCLVLASNGKFYGLTNSGGANGVGALYEYAPGSTTITKKYDFTGSAAAGSNDIRGSMVVSSNGKLYGTTNLGGANNLGIIFEYDPATATFTKKLDFDGTNGANPWRGSLTLGPSVTPVVTGDLVSTGLAQIVVSPNPVASRFTVTIRGTTGEKQIFLYDLAGREVHHSVTNENEISIDASGLASGLYLVRTVTDNYSSVSKIVKIK